MTSLCPSVVVCYLHLSSSSSTLWSSSSSNRRRYSSFLLWVDELSPWWGSFFFLSALLYPITRIQGTSKHLTKLKEEAKLYFIGPHHPKMARGGSAITVTPRPSVPGASLKMVLLLSLLLLCFIKFGASSPQYWGDFCKVLRNWSKIPCSCIGTGVILNLSYIYPYHSILPLGFPYLGFLLCGFDY